MSRHKSSLDDGEVLDLFFKKAGDEKNKIISHIEYILKNDGTLFHLGIEWDFLGFLEDYYSEG